MITCLENIEMIQNEAKIQLGVVTTNIFEYNRSQEKWLIVHHHGSPVSNYFPPPLIQIWFLIIYHLEYMITRFKKGSKKYYK